MEAIQELGIQIILIIQGAMPALDTIMKVFTFLGRIEFYLIFITFLYWIVDASLGLKIFMVLLSTDIVSTAFKQLFHQPRPYWISEVQHFGIEEPSYGVPSSHASDSLAVWAYLAYQTKKVWMWITSIVLILMISLSRLYLGVHFPQDIIVGWVIGLIVLILFIKVEENVSIWFQSHSETLQIGLGFVLSILFLITGLIVRTIISGSSDPEGWAQYAIHARSLTHYLTIAGAFFGAVAGYVMMKSKINFRTEGSWAQKLGRYAVGIVGVLIIMYGLDMVFSQLAGDESFTGYLLRYIRYALTTFWVMFGAPWVYLRLRLANTKE